MTRGFVLLAVAMGAVALLCPAPAALAAEKAIWGPLERPDGGSAMGIYRSLGVDTLQVQLRFADAAPTRPERPVDPDDPAYRWPERLDRAVLEARRSGIDIALLVTRSPPWANGGRSQLWAPSPSAYADFLTAAARRYPSVQRWQIWGEPNSAGSFLPNRPDSPVGPRAYARILDAGYVALKRVARRNIVIGGMTFSAGDVKPVDFLRFMRLPSGRRPRLDWFGHNPFPFGYPDLRKGSAESAYRDISDIEVFAKEVVRAYTRPCRSKPRRRCGRRPKLWLSEFTVQSDHSSNVFELSVGRAAQARWLRAAYEIADSLPAVAGLGWFSLYDKGDSPTSANWGLLSASGERKPSYFAYRRAPSVALRPRVRLRQRRLDALAGGRRRAALVGVRPRVRGRVVVELRASGGRLVRRVAREVAAGRPARMLRAPRRLRRGRYAVVVDAPRGERVRRSVRVR
jgi:hypothetical protein